jgi:hypothetical protein
MAQYEGENKGDRKAVMRTRQWDHETTLIV